LPSQVAARVATPAAQDAGLHTSVVGATAAQVVGSAPSQRRALQGDAASPAQAVRVPCGVPLIVVHLPALPSPSHA
jgi:hypothetical protein